MLLDDPLLDALLRGFVLAMAGLLWAVVQIRVLGLRSLSKMTTFDFVMTIALGSLLAGAAQASEWTAFGQALAGMLGLFVLQGLAGKLRQSSDTAEEIMQNSPILLMRDGVIDHDALAQTRVAESDLIAKLREANVLDMDKVRAVVLETTGDVSVLHGDALQETLLSGVERSDRE